MIIAVTSDNHTNQMGPKAQENFNAMLQNVMEPSNKVDAFCIAGDLGGGSLMPSNCFMDALLGTHPNTLFVMGNHDLFKKAGKKKTPDIAMEDNLKLFNFGTPLETSWEDKCTVVDIGDCSFVGTIGFPDFNHPSLPMPRKCYDNKENHQTIDSTYISIKRWCDWTDSINTAFKVRLDKAVSGGQKNIVIISHYPHFQSHSFGNCQDPVWPYFYNYQLGVMILEASKSNPDKKFWSIAGHAHEYCLGLWKMEWDNLYTLGIRTTYVQNSCYIFDTDKDPLADRLAR